MGQEHGRSSFLVLSGPWCCVKSRIGSFQACHASRWTIACVSRLRIHTMSIHLDPLTLEKHTSIALPHRCHPCSHWTCQTHVAVWNRCSQASWCCSWALRGSLGLQHVWLGSLLLVLQVHVVYWRSVFRYPMFYAFPYFQLNSGWLDAIFCHVNDPRMETKEKDGFSAWLQASDRCRDLYIVHLLGNLTPQPKLDSLCRTRQCRLRNGMQRIKVKSQKLMPAIKAVRDPFLFPVALRSLPESTGTCLFKCIGQLLCGLLPHFLNLAALNPAHPQRMARISPMAYWIPFIFSDLRAFCYPLSLWPYL